MFKVFRIFNFITVQVSWSSKGWWTVSNMVDNTVIHNVFSLQIVTKAGIKDYQIILGKFAIVAGLTNQK
jgi:hypothetical protein